MTPAGNGIGIVGVGAFLPPTVRTNDWWAAPVPGLMAQTTDAVPSSAAARLAKLPMAGTRERRVLDAGEPSSDMEARACADALDAAGRSIREVDLLVGYSQVPDDPGPGNHGRVARALGLGAQGMAFTLDAGCAAFLTQLTTAVRLVGAKDASCALLYQSSASSRILDPNDDASWLLGDGAAAQVVGPVGAGLGFVGSEQRIVADLCDGLVLAPSDGRRDWVQAGARLVITARDRQAAVQMGAAGPAFAKDTCGALLDRFNLSAESVDYFVCAQPTVWFAEACAEAIGIRSGRWLPPQAHFQRFGHLLAGSVGLNLHLAFSARLLREGDLVLIYSPGVGFTQAAVLLRWSMLPVRRLLPEALPAR